MDTLKKKQRVAMLSVISNTTLVGLKLLVGLLIGSVSVISEAIHSAVDLMAAVIALFAVRTAGKPEDTRHAYGHGKIENISGTIEALLIFLAAVWIIYEAAHKLLKPQPIEQAGFGVIVMTLSAAANFFVSTRLFRVGNETDSIALKADAWHLRTDVYTSLGVMTGLLLYWAGSFFFPHVNFMWLDPAAALIVALLIVKTAYDLTRESVRDLLDTRLSREDELLIDRFVTERQPLAKSYHKLRTRKSGSQRFFEFHLVVDPKMSVRESHDLGDTIVAGVKSRYPDAKVVIHVEPCDETCTEDCLDHCNEMKY
jgi:cation diffusion facilitator family transporter